MMCPDIVFCVSDCANTQCTRHRSNAPKEDFLSYGYFSEECKDYQKQEGSS